MVHRIRPNIQLGRPFSIILKFVLMMTIDMDSTFNYGLPITTDPGSLLGRYLEPQLDSTWSAVSSVVVMFVYRGQCVKTVIRWKRTPMSFLSLCIFFCCNLFIV